jgi:hypothetical protein
MAQQEILIGGAFGDALLIYLRYDDVSLQCNRLRWVNNTGRTIEAAFTRPNGDNTKVQIPASGSGSRALAAGTVNMLERNVDGETYLVFDASFSFVTTNTLRA